VLLSINDIIKEKNIDIMLLIGPLMDHLVFNLHAENNKTNIILFGLFIILADKISRPDVKIKRYYLNDYDKINEFIIYSIPDTYNADISKLSTDLNVKLITDFKNPFSNSVAYKFSLSSYIKETLVKKYIAPMVSKTMDNVTEEDLNKTIPIIKDNTNHINILLNHLLAANLLMVNLPDIPSTAKIFQSLVILYDLSKFTDKFNELINKKEKPTIDNIYKTIKENYNKNKYTN
jgi:hypothetical protein